MPGASGGEFGSRWRRGRQSYWAASERQVHVLQPVGGSRDDAHILGQMLQGQRLDRNGNAIGIDDDRAEMAHGFLNSLHMVIDRAVREVRKADLARVDYLDSCWATP